MLLAVEALQRNESVLVNSVEELQHLLKEVQRDALKVCLDTGAMAMAGNTIQQYFDVFHDGAYDRSSIATCTPRPGKRDGFCLASIFPDVTCGLFKPQLLHQRMQGALA